jgi:hypothetical protein
MSNQTEGEGEVRQLLVRRREVGRVGVCVRPVAV